MCTSSACSIYSLNPEPDRGELIFFNSYLIPTIFQILNSFIVYYNSVIFYNLRLFRTGFFVMVYDIEHTYKLVTYILKRFGGQNKRFAEIVLSPNRAKLGGNASFCGAQKSNTK